jgi:hypothetical protein
MCMRMNVVLFCTVQPVLNKAQEVDADRLIKVRLQSRACKSEALFWFISKTLMQECAYECSAIVLVSLVARPRCIYMYTLLGTAHFSRNATECKVAMPMFHLSIRRQKHDLRECIAVHTMLLACIAATTYQSHHVHPLPRTQDTAAATRPPLRQHAAPANQMLQCHYCHCALLTPAGVWRAHVGRGARLQAQERSAQGLCGQLLGRQQAAPRQVTDRTRTDFFFQKWPKIVGSLLDFAGYQRWYS